MTASASGLLAALGAHNFEANGRFYFNRVYFIGLEGTERLDADSRDAWKAVQLLDLDYEIHSSHHKARENGHGSFREVVHISWVFSKKASWADEAAYFVNVPPPGREADDD